MTAIGIGIGIGIVGRLRRDRVTIVSAVGLYQGLSLLAFPVATAVLGSRGSGLSRGQFGVLVALQALLVVAGLVAHPVPRYRAGFKFGIATGLFATTLAVVLLAATDPLRTKSVAYPVLLLAALVLGLGIRSALRSLTTCRSSLALDRRRLGRVDLPAPAPISAWSARFKPPRIGPASGPHARRRRQPGAAGADRHESPRAGASPASDPGHAPLPDTRARVRPAVSAGRAGSAIRTTPDAADLMRSATAGAQPPRTRSTCPL